ncbi:flagellar hook-length control protein FliK [Chthonobacter rhizosphaerae]|uniref:flagellar hook-length control protein FliK n=1 Tax=Chthonobacter rhizosphaerae TaxID=2735553 RepID=UPI0015EECF85|nr:flagellar hook-length control protein FliK [Chthonobacter rhizosphaerae]
MSHDAAAGPVRAAPPGRPTAQARPESGPGQGDGFAGHVASVAAEQKREPNGGTPGADDRQRGGNGGSGGDAAKAARTPAQKDGRADATGATTPDDKAADAGSTDATAPDRPAQAASDPGVGAQWSLAALAAAGARDPGASSAPLDAAAASRPGQRPGGAGTDGRDPSSARGPGGPDLMADLVLPDLETLKRQLDARGDRAAQGRPAGADPARPDGQGATTLALMLQETARTAPAGAPGAAGGQGATMLALMLQGSPRTASGGAGGPLPDTLNGIAGAAADGSDPAEDAGPEPKGGPEAPRHGRTSAKALFERIAARVAPAVEETMRRADRFDFDAAEAIRAEVVRQETHLPVMADLSLAGQQVSARLESALAALPKPGAAPGVKVDLSAPPVHVMEIQLQPEALGSVRVELRAAGDRLAVRIIADNQETARLLEADSSALTRRLETAGYAADRLQIQVVTDGSVPRLALDPAALQAGLDRGAASAGGGAATPGGSGQSSWRQGQDERKSSRIDQDASDRQPDLVRRHPDGALYL